MVSAVIIAVGLPERNLIPASGTAQPACGARRKKGGTEGAAFSSSMNVSRRYFFSGQ
jgi:hypothetical protein